MIALTETMVGKTETKVGGLETMVAEFVTNVTLWIASLSLAMTGMKSTMMRIALEMTVKYNWKIQKYILKKRKVQILPHTRFIPYSKFW
ncbi:MAG: hypothetical protein LBR28_01350 [Bacteroidales bacterium]|nr:hypothetical protein [Bacteroidales bacterium]